LDGITRRARLTSRVIQRHECTLFFTGNTQRGLASGQWLETLAKEKNWAAETFSFHKTELGQPVLMVNGQTIHCSVSHAVGLTAIGLHHHCFIGVDVERIDEQQGDNDLLATFFPSIAPPARSDVNNDFFLQHWTAREALLKARGTGFLDDKSALTLPFGAELKSWIETSGEHRWRISQISLPDHS